MARTVKIAGLNNQDTVRNFTVEEETARDAEEKEWADGADARKMVDIRGTRDALLASTDWAALPDSPAMSDSMTAYRKALRDYPATYTADNSAAWPTLGD
tara:strand:- start:523 stop:822 length:300 start_codon:yes stop_codon:yes gene_type:complete